jgi:hypothetical protein
MYCWASDAEHGCLPCLVNSGRVWWLVPMGDLCVTAGWQGGRGRVLPHVMSWGMWRCISEASPQRAVASVFALPAQAARSLREALAKCPSTQGKVPQVIGE